MEEFLKFKKMITPIIIQILFWIGVVVCVIWGLAAIVTGISGHAEHGGQIVFAGLLMLLIGPVLVRVYCEILIVLFSINTTLTQIKDKMRDTTV
jgi:hypothetical protein